MVDHFKGVVDEPKMDPKLHLEGMQEWLGQYEQFNASLNALSAQEQIATRIDLLVKARKLSFRFALAIQTEDVRAAVTFVGARLGAVVHLPPDYGEGYEAAATIHNEGIIPASRTLQEAVPSDLLVGKSIDSGNFTPVPNKNPKNEFHSLKSVEYPPKTLRGWYGMDK